MTIHHELLRRPKHIAMHLFTLAVQCTCHIPSRESISNILLSAIRCVFRLVYSHCRVVRFHSLQAPTRDRSVDTRAEDLQNSYPNLALAELSVRRSGFVISTQQAFRWATNPTTKPPSSHQTRMSRRHIIPTSSCFGRQLGFAFVASATRLGATRFVSDRGPKIHFRTVFAAKFRLGFRLGFSKLPQRNHNFVSASYHNGF